MKNIHHKIRTALILFYGVVGTVLHAHGQCETVVYTTDNEVVFPYSGGTQTIVLNIEPFSCFDVPITFSNVPNWITIRREGQTPDPNGNKLIMTCLSLQPGQYRDASISIDVNGFNHGGFSIEQGESCARDWYKDTDGDGFGDYYSTPTYSCTAPPGWVDNDLDQCYEEFSTTNNGCPENIVQDNLNWVHNSSFDITGKLIGNSIAFYDKLGKNTQNQTLNIKTQKIWATQTVYDAQGRPALSTFGAPIGTDFGYKEDFIKKPNGTTFTSSDLGDNVYYDPTAIGDQANTLGWYYSPKNTSEPYQDVTSRPYGRTFFSELNPGTALRSVGGNKINHVWKNGYSFTMPASQELSQKDAFDDPIYNDYKHTKTVVRDVHGVESVVFTDTEGNILAAARSGNQEKTSLPIRNMSIVIGKQGYIDVHIPVGCKGITIGGASMPTKVYNLIRELPIQVPLSSVSELNPGFYRVAVDNPDTYDPDTPVIVRYPENYYDYSLNYYDKVGRLIKSTQPLSKDLESEYKYNTLGQLLYTKSPDEGEAWFKYRKDGQIRYSQNSKQKLANETSYTNYDELGRPVESGVLVNSNFDSLKPDDILLSGTRKEQLFTVYDTSDANGILTAFNGSPRRINYNQTFVAGAVAKTYTKNPETTTTWYSYDHYGRVKWIVQKIEGLLAPKTIDYLYDDITGAVSKVYFQKEYPGEQFVHRYTYDPDDYSLVKVETSEDDRTFTEQAAYSYYETGALKRTEIGNGLQGIDYVYNLNGALKSINHPSLQAGKDPGGDTNDVFGMNLHYYKGDYKRNNTPKPIATIPTGTDQYNGNIKATEWQTKGNGEGSYYYQYNRNNWLTEANFGSDEVGGSVPETLELTETISTDQEAIASKRIRLTSFFKVPEGTRFSTRFEESSGSGNDDYRVSNVTYDANGNIQSLDRNKNTAANGNKMDKLSYNYRTDKPNQLLRVDDAVTETTNADDIKDQNGDNYIYNSIGQLAENVSENITYDYNVAGLVSEIRKEGSPLVKFFYDDRGHRVRKESLINGFTEHYVRDLTGNVMAIYRDEQPAEYPIYGSGRVGVYKKGGATSYQLTDHLGNVRAVVSNTQTDNTPSTATDYYPFGMAMPDRNLVGGYRYAYQGQEKDPETGKEAFQLRLWDGRIGRWLTTDPYGQYSSPYLGMGNNPISLTDPDGGMTDDFDPNDAAILPGEAVVRSTYTGNDPNWRSIFDTSHLIPEIAPIDATKFVLRDFNKQPSIWSWIDLPSLPNILVIGENGPIDNENLPKPRDSNTTVIDRNEFNDLMSALGIRNAQKEKITLGPVTSGELLKKSTERHLRITDEPVPPDTVWTGKVQIYFQRDAPTIRNDQIIINGDTTWLPRPNNRPNRK